MRHVITCIVALSLSLSAAHGLAQSSAADASPPRTAPRALSDAEIEGVLSRAIALNSAPALWAFVRRYKTPEHLYLRAHVQLGELLLESGDADSVRAYLAEFDTAALEVLYKAHYGPDELPSFSELNMELSFWERGEQAEHTQDAYDALGESATLAELLAYAEAHPPEHISVFSDFHYTVHARIAARFALEGSFDQITRYMGYFSGAPAANPTMCAVIEAALRRFPDRIDALATQSAAVSRTIGIELANDPVNHVLSTARATDARAWARYATRAAAQDDLVCLDLARERTTSLLASTLTGPQLSALYPTSTPARALTPEVFEGLTQAAMRLAPKQLRALVADAQVAPQARAHMFCHAHLKRANVWDDTQAQDHHDQLATSSAPATQACWTRLEAHIEARAEAQARTAQAKLAKTWPSRIKRHLASCKRTKAQVFQHRVLVFNAAMHGAPEDIKEVLAARMHASVDEHARHLRDIVLLYGELAEAQDPRAHQLITRARAQCGLSSP